MQDQPPIPEKESFQLAINGLNLELRKKVRRLFDLASNAARYERLIKEKTG